MRMGTMSKAYPRCGRCLPQWGAPSGCLQETFDLNSFWITPLASDLTVTLAAFRLGQFLGSWSFDIDADQSRVPISLPQPLFLVRRSGA